MASRSGKMVAGTDGMDYHHRERVADQYSGREGGFLVSEISIKILVFSVCLQQVSAEGAGGDAPAAGAAAQRAAAAGAAAAPRPPAPRAARRRVRAAAARRHRVRLAPLPPLRLHGALRVQEVQSRSVGFQDHLTLLDSNKNH